MQDNSSALDKGKEKESRSGKRRKVISNTVVAPMPLDEEDTTNNDKEEEGTGKTAKTSQKNSKSISGKLQRGGKVSSWTMNSS